MPDTQRESSAKIQLPETQSVESQPDSTAAITPQRDPLAQITARPEGNVQAHAAALNRAAGSRLSRAGGSILQLQRQYGNRYVQRVVAAARQGALMPVQAAGLKADALPPPFPILPANSGGSPLSQEVQTKMETAFSADFSDVRIHEGPAAISIGALAYTQGNHIQFAPGKYDPSSQSGQRLLGHELTHVVQQRAGRVQGLQGAGATINVDQALEAEADTLGAKAARGEASPVRGANSSPGGQAKAVVQPKLGFEIEIAVLVDINGRPVPEKVPLGTVGQHLELTVDQNSQVEAQTPTTAAAGAYDLRTGWQRIAAHVNTTTNTVTFYDTEVEANTAHPGPLPADEEIKPAYRNTQNGEERLSHPHGPGMGSENYASIVEIVTKAYEPEVPAEAQNLRTAMTEAAAFANALDPHNRVALNTIPNVNARSPNIYIGNTNSPNQTVNGSIQSTLGVRTAQLPAFIRSSMQTQNQGLFRLKHATEAEEQQGAFIQREMLAAVDNAETVITQIGNTLHHWYRPNEQIELHAIRGLFALICQYLRLGKYAYDPQTAKWGLDKNAVALMSRTDLSIIRRNLPSKQRDWLADNRRAIIAALLTETNRQANTTLFTSPDETQRSGYKNKVTTTQFLNNIFTQNTDGVTPQFGAIKQMGPEVVRRGGLFGKGEKRGPVFEVRNMVPPTGAGNGRFPPNTWLNLAEYYINLLSALNTRATAEQEALSTTDLGVHDPGIVRVNTAALIQHLEQENGVNQDLLNVMKSLKRTTTSVKRLVV